MNNEFLEAFFKIDSDMSEEITLVELERYMRKNNLKDAFIKKWINIFDENQDGVISLEEYCNVLGLVLDEARIMREQFQTENSAPNELPDDVEIIFSNLPKEIEIEIVDIEKKATKTMKNSNEVSKHIKQELDQLHEPSWHCIILLGQYWINSTTVPNGCFHYKRGRYIYIIWQTAL